MSEYVFKDAPGFGFDMDGQMETLPMTAREYYASNCADHYGTLHEEIVRCKDCKRFIPQGTYQFNSGVVDKNRCGVIRGFVVQIEPDGFCAWGERKVVKR